MSNQMQHVEARRTIELRWLAIGIGAVGLVFAISSLILKSAVRDEGAYLLSGWLLWTGQAWQQWSTMIHAPLACYVYGWLPVVFEMSNPGDQLFWSRLMHLGWYIGMLVGVYRWSAQLWMARGAVLSVALAVLSPNVMAHARLVTMESPLACILVWWTYSAWGWVTTGRRTWLAAWAIWTGVGLATKFTATLLLPTLGAILMLWMVAGWRNEGQTDERRVLRAAWAALQVSVVSVCILNSSYWWTHTFQWVRNVHWLSQFMRGMMNHTWGQLVTWLLPLPYLKGLDFVRYFSEHGFTSYLAGQGSMDGWWQHYPVVWLIKTPVPMLGLLGLGGVTMLRGRWRGKGLWVLGLPVTAYVMYFVVLNRFHISLRHLVPLEPLLCVWLGGLAGSLWAAARWRRITLYVLLGWLAINHLAIYPHYLAYANGLIGGPRQAYRWLSDADLEWGQDHLLVGQYLVDHPMVEVGSSEPVLGRQVVSATMWQDTLTARPAFGWLRHFEPVDWIGYSWLVFDFTVEACERVVEEHPEDPDAWYAMIRAYQLAGQMEEALAAATRGQVLHDASAQLWFAEALVLRELGDIEGAVERWLDAVALDTYDPMSWSYLAVVYEHEGRAADAMAARHQQRVAESVNRYLKPVPLTRATYEAMVVDEPAQSRHWNNVGFWRWAEGDLVGAREALERALHLEPNHGDALANLVAVLEDQQEWTAAIDAHRRYLNLLPSPDLFQEPRYFGPQGVIMFNESFVVSQRLLPDERRYHDVLSRRAALALGEVTAGAWLAIGTEWAALGELTMALNAFRQAQRIDPGILEAGQNEAMVYQSFGFTDWAVDASSNTREVFIRE